MSGLSASPDAFASALKREGPASPSRRTRSGPQPGGGGPALPGRRRRGGFPGRRVPVPPLIALVLVGLIGVVALLPEQRPAEPERVLAGRDLVVHTLDNGDTRITDAGTGALAGLIPAGGESFVRGVLHGTAVQRRLNDVSAGTPYHLELLSDGRVVLTDPSIHDSIDLESFGSTNAAAFVALLGGLTRPHSPADPDHDALGHTAAGAPVPAAVAATQVRP